MCVTEYFIHTRVILTCEINYVVNQRVVSTQIAKWERMNSQGVHLSLIALLTRKSLGIDKLKSHTLIKIYVDVKIPRVVENPFF